MHSADNLLLQFEPFPYRRYVSVAYPLGTLGALMTCRLWFSPTGRSGNGCAPKRARSHLQSPLKGRTRRAKTPSAAALWHSLSKGEVDRSTLSCALEAAGVEFIPENGGGARVRLRKPGA